MYLYHAQLRVYEYSVLCTAVCYVACVSLYDVVVVYLDYDTVCRTELRHVLRGSTPVLLRVFPSARVLLVLPYYYVVEKLSHDARVFGHLLLIQVATGDWTAGMRCLEHGRPLCLWQH